MSLTHAVILAALAVSAYAFPAPVPSHPQDDLGRLTSLPNRGSTLQSLPEGHHSTKPPAVQSNNIFNFPSSTEQKHNDGPTNPRVVPLDDDGRYPSSTGNHHSTKPPAGQSDNIFNFPSSTEQKHNDGSTNPRVVRPDDDVRYPSSTRHQHSTKPPVVRPDDDVRYPSSTGHHHSTKTPVVRKHVPVITHGRVTHYDIDVPVYSTPVVVYTRTYIEYSRINIFSRGPSFEYPSCQYISQDLSTFISGFGQIAGTLQSTSWDVEQTAGVLREACSNYDLITLKVVGYDFSSDVYPTCRQEFTNALVQFLKQLQISFSLILQRFGSFAQFDDILAQCYSALQRSFGVMRSMDLDVEQVFRQIDLNFFSQVKLNIDTFRNADTASLLQAGLPYTSN